MSQLGDLVTRVTYELQDVAFTYFEEANIKQAIGDAYQYYTMLAIDAGQGWFQTAVNLPITAGVETISLTSLTPTFYSVAILKKNIPTARYPLTSSVGRFEVDITLGVGAYESYMPQYKVRGLNLVLNPRPLTAEAATDTTGLRLEYNYIPVYPNATTVDTFEFDANFPTVFEPMIILMAATTVFEQKDGMGAVSDTNAFRLRLQKFEQSYMDSFDRDEYPDTVTYIGLDYY
jgi:hypothetical protein